MVFKYIKLSFDQVMFDGEVLLNVIGGELLLKNIGGVNVVFMIMVLQVLKMVDGKGMLFDVMWSINIYICFVVYFEMGELYVFVELQDNGIMVLLLNIELVKKMVVWVWFRVEF